MKKTILILFFLLCLFSLIFNSSYTILNSAFAQELSIKEATESSSVDNKELKVQYELPYPGILPDNPLYFLKAIRDAIVDLLIFDPLKKADFYLLQADKRLNAGVYLVNNKNKYELAESTISKGENYFEKAIGKIREAEKQGMDIGAVTNRLFVSSQKHQEVIKDLLEKADEKNKDKFSNLLKRAENYQKEVELLKAD